MWILINNCVWGHILAINGDMVSASMHVLFKTFNILPVSAVPSLLDDFVVNKLWKKNSTVSILKHNDDTY